jgi:citrate lyase beta subunit
LLFVPGDSPRKLEKAAQLDVDCVILDLEDAVAVSQKEVARAMVATAVLTHTSPASERLIRINASHTPFFAADLAAVANLPIDGIVIPKVETADPFHYAAQMTKLPLFAIIETALGIMNLKEIAQAAPQLVGLLFGAEDLTADLGAAPSPDKRELFYARSAVVTAAAAYGLQAIDTVYTDLHNFDGLATEAQSARQMGYTGKMAVHPHQVSTIQQIFSPTEAEIAQAQAIITAYQAHLVTGEGVFVWNGRMVDKPIVRAAEQVLARARSAHLLDE